MRRLHKVRLLTVLFILCLASVAWAGSQQTSSTTGSTLITRARYILNEDTASRWTDTELLSYVNDGIIDISSKTLCLENSENLTLATNTREYSLSGNYFQIETCMYDDGTNQTVGLTRCTPRDAGHIEEDAGQPLRWYLWNNKIGVDPEPDSTASGNTVTVYYYERPSTIAASGTNPLPAHYDELLVEYVVAQALRADGKYAKAALHWAIYRMELDRYRVDFNTQVKESEDLLH